MSLLYMRCLVVCLAAVVPGPAALIDFTSRTDFQNSTTLNASLTNSNGVDFSSAALCPTLGCAPSTGNVQFTASSSGANGPSTAAFSLLPGFSIQGFGTSSTGQTGLWLSAANWSSPAGPTVLKYGIPVMNTRDVHQSSNPVRVRVNLPTGTTSFAIDLSNGCKINVSTGSVPGCDPGDNQMGSIRITTSAGDSRVVNITDASNSVGEFRFYGARSDTPITWIELSLPTVDEFGASITNFGSIVFTRIAYGQTAVPEPATWICLAAGMALILLRRRANGL